MKKKIVLLVALFLLLSVVAFVKTKAQTNDSYRKWWDERHPGKAFEFANPKKLPLIKVVGNHFEDESGKTVLFRGVSISDPDKIQNQGNWNKTVFTRLSDVGVKLVRIPVHPVSWRDRTAEGYLKLIDEAVTWATDAGIYLIIDWHSIGNLKSELFQDPMYNTSKTETFTFWRTIASRYKGINTIAFYELFNEPTVYRNQLGLITWDEWKALNKEMIAIIRAFDTETIPMVAGFDWAYDLTLVRYSPLDEPGICYVTHPYPNKRKPPYESQWHNDFGFVAQTFPVVATEIGFTNRNLDENLAYGNAIINYLEGNGISWLAWVVDHEWGPNMIESWDSFKYTQNGQFFIDVMKKHK